MNITSQNRSGLTLCWLIKFGISTNSSLLGKREDTDLDTLSDVTNFILKIAR